MRYSGPRLIRVPDTDIISTSCFAHPGIYIKAAEEDDVAEGRINYYAYIETQQNQPAKILKATDSP